MKREKGSKSGLARSIIFIVAMLEVWAISCGCSSCETANAIDEDYTASVALIYMDKIGDLTCTYDGKPHAYEFTPPPGWKIGKLLYSVGQSSFKEAPTDAGIYSVSFNLFDKKGQDVFVAYPEKMVKGGFLRTLTINPADPALKAENQSFDWTGKKIAPKYSAVSGASVKLDCKSDLTSPGIHEVRLYVEKGNYAEAQCSISVTINPQVSFIMGRREVVTHAPYGGTVTPPDVRNVPAGCRFVGWDAEIPDEITQNLVFTAVYRRLEKASYNIGFVINADVGAVIVPTARGQLPVAPDAATIADYTPDGMRFAGWSPTIVPANADVTYYAVFEPLSYTISFNMNGHIETVTTAYGEAPTAPSADLAQNYAPIDTEFTGWSPAIVPATANVTYYAQYA